MNLSEKAVLIIAVTAVAGVAVSHNMAALYHGYIGIQAFIAGGASFLLFCTLIALALSSINLFRTGLLKLFLLGLAFLTIHSIADPHLGDGGPATQPWLQIMIACVTFTIAGILLIFAKKNEHWSRLGKAITVASLIFSLTPIAWGFALGLRNNMPIETLNLDSMIDRQYSKNSIVIVLDETSPEYSPILIRPLEDAKLIVVGKEVEAAGKNTGNAIPSMLTGLRYDNVIPCAMNSLCGSNSIDFTSLIASNKKSDIIGFFHPYCGINGLRSCVKQEKTVETWLGGFKYFFCYSFNKKNLLKFCNASGAHGAGISFVEIRRLLVEKMHKAPFWQEGGLLYIHIPLPHPPSNKAHSTLKEEYEENITDAADLLGLLSKKLKDRFGDDFLLIVTSDHALRVLRHCTYPMYKNENCSKDLPPNRNKVPLIIATPRLVDVYLPDTNVGLLVK